MLRYAMAAFALKAFSINSLTRKAYRALGNTIGGRSRRTVSDLDIRVERGDLLVELCRRHGVLKGGDHILEIGTGWMHWYSLYLRLFFDLRVTALDIWDNRQFLALQAAATKLLAVFEGRREDPDAIAILRRVAACGSFEELYQLLGYEYVIEPTGSIGRFADGAFDLVTSFHVLEHVPADRVSQLCRDMFRTLKPGAYAIHQIGIDDHLTHYDPSASPKQYLEYSDRTWRLLFENEVQYFNRLQTSDWRRLFEGAGFELVDERAEAVDIAGLDVHQRFSGYPGEDLRCTILTLVYRKPLPDRSPGRL